MRCLSPSPFAPVANAIGAANLLALITARCVGKFRVAERFAQCRSGFATLLNYTNECFIG